MSALPNPARSRAVDVLAGFFRDPRRLDLEAASRGLGESDRGLFLEIVRGVLRWRGRLDREIATLLPRGFPGISPKVREILEVSLYQIRHLDRIPPRAVVFEAVEMARAAAGSGADRFVNAILRRLLREPGGASDAVTAEEIAADHAIPPFLAKRWIERFGRDVAARLLASTAERDRFELLANLLKGTREEIASRLKTEGIETRPIEGTPAGLAVESGNPLRTACFSRGDFYVADAGSQLLALLLPEGDLLLDLAAAPGGKSIAALTTGRFRRAIASDRSLPRLARLAQNRSRLSLPEMLPVASDLAAGAFPADRFPRVLLDAACSGTGTLRKNPDLRYRLTEARISSLAADQRRQLSAAARVVAPGGFLLYATCSLETEENEDVVAGLLAERPDFSPAAIRAPPEVVRFIHGNRIRIVPDRDRDGFTAHLLRRTE